MNEEAEPSRRRYQFSLRTMLAGMAAAAVLFSLWPFMAFHDGGIHSKAGWRMTSPCRDALFVGIPVIIAWGYWRKYKNIHTPDG